MKALFTFVQCCICWLSCHTVIHITDVLTDELQSLTYPAGGACDPLLHPQLLVSPLTKLDDDRPPSHHVTINKLHGSLCLLLTCSMQWDTGHSQHSIQGHTAPPPPPPPPPWGINSSKGKLVHCRIWLPSSSKVLNDNVILFKVSATTLSLIRTV